MGYPPTMMYIKRSSGLRKENRAEHVRRINIQRDLNNNKMERFNAELRSRESDEGLEKVGCSLPKRLKSTTTT